MLTHDLFKICERIKKIHPSYFIVFNSFKKEYEVHSSCQKPTLCFKFRGCLDYRALERTMKTRVENINNLLDEIEENNLRVENENNNRTKTQAMSELKNKMFFLEQKSSPVDFCSISNKNWI